MSTPGRILPATATAIAIAAAMTNSVFEELIASLWTDGASSLGEPQVHLLIDAAREPAIASMIRQGGLEWRYLFVERLARGLPAAAPCVVRLLPGSALTRILLEHFLDGHWGILAQSPAGISVACLRLHLRRVLQGRGQAGTPMAVPFYDLHRLGEHLSNCTLGERIELLGPFSKICLPGATLIRPWREFTHQGAVATMVPGSSVLKEEQGAAPDLAQLLKSLKRRKWDLRVFVSMLPDLRWHLARASYRVQRDWMAALHSLSRQTAPATSDIAFECGLLAAAMLRFAGAASCFERSLAFAGAHAATHFNLALCRRHLAEHGAAERHLMAALAIVPGERRYTGQLAQTREHSKLCHEVLGDDRIFDPELQYRFLSATLLGRHHAETLYRRLDPATAAQTGLPAFAGLPETRRWIRDQQGNQQRQALAVLHPEHGLIGTFGIDQRHNAAVFYYWITPAMRGLGFGYAVLALVLECARRAEVARLYAAVAIDNIRSRNLMAQAGFEEMPIDAHAFPEIGAMAPFYAINLAPWDDDVAPHHYAQELALVLRDIGALQDSAGGQA